MNHHAQQPSPHNKLHSTTPDLDHHHHQKTLQKKYPRSEKDFPQKHKYIAKNNRPSNNSFYQEQSIIIPSQKACPKVKNHHKSKTHVRSLSSMNASTIKFTDDEKKIFYLTPQLQQISSELESKKKSSVEIKYVNTLKKVKLAAGKMNYKIRAKSTGIEIETARKKQSNKVQDKQHMIEKVVNRYMKSKTMSKIKQCSQSSISHNNRMKSNIDDMKLAVQQNQKSNEYKEYTARRMQTYMNSMANKNIIIPFYCKYDIQNRIHNHQIQQLLSNDQILEQAEQIESTSINQFIQSPTYPQNNKMNKTITDRGSKNSTSTKWTVLLKRNEEDIVEFMEICQFFKKIQNQILKYLPNVHLHNKVMKLIGQVKFSSAIMQIYNKSNLNIGFFNPVVIVDYLKKNDGLLSQMNYIANVIKLSISAQRRKRFKEVEKSISTFQKYTKQTVSKITQKISKIQNKSMKSSIVQTVNKIDLSCNGLKAGYLNYINAVQSQEMSLQTTFKSINSRRIICDILKFQALMK